MGGEACMAIKHGKLIALFGKPILISSAFGLAMYIYTSRNGAITKQRVLLDSSYTKTYTLTPRSSSYVYQFQRYGTIREKYLILAAILDFESLKISQKSIFGFQ